jgi:hypothetical protein
MKSLRFTQALLLCGLSTPVLAQVEDDPLARLKACSQKSGADRLECLEELSRRMNQPPATSGVAAATAAAKPDNWIISTTTSPVNYRPIVVASTPSRSNSDRAVSLSVSCRNGRTELAVTSNADAKPGRGGGTIMVAHQINDQPPTQQRWTASVDGKGATFAGDVVGLLQSLPDRGEIGFRVFDRQGVLYDGKFLLDGLGIVREKVAAACKWPSVVAATPR